MLNILAIAIDWQWLYHVSYTLFVCSTGAYVAHRQSWELIYHLWCIQVEVSYTQVDAGF